MNIVPVPAPCPGLHGRFRAQLNQPLARLRRPILLPRKPREVLAHQRVDGRVVARGVGPHGREHFVIDRKRNILHDKAP